MNVRIKPSLSLLLLTIFDAFLRSEAAINHATTHENHISPVNQDSNLNISADGFINRNSNDNSQSNGINRDINIRNQFSVANPLENDAQSNSEPNNNVINNPNFLITDFLSDGEIERRISYNGVTAKETQISTNGYVIIGARQLPISLIPFHYF